MLNIQNNLLKTNFTSNNPVNTDKQEYETITPDKNLEFSPEQDTVELTGKNESKVTEPNFNVFNIQKDDGTNLTMKTSFWKGQTITGTIGGAEINLKNKINFFNPRKRSLKGTVDNQEVNIKYTINKKGEMIFDEETQEKYGDLINTFTDLSDSYNKAKTERLAKALSITAITSMHNGMNNNMQTQLMDDQIAQQNLFMQQQNLFMQQNQSFMHHNDIINQQMMGMM